MKKLVLIFVGLMAITEVAGATTTTTTTTTSDGCCVASSTAKKKHKKEVLVSSAESLRPVYVPEEPKPYREPSRSSSMSPYQMRGGLELGVGNYPGVSNVSNMTGFGILGDYALDRQLSIEGRMAFMNYSVNSPHYYNYWSTYALNSSVNYNQIDLTLGPIYRLTTRRFSPIVGGMLGYSHRYYTLPATTYYSYSYNSTGGYSGNSDTFSIGGLIGVEYDITRDMSIGADLRYMIPLSYASSTPYYYPANGTPVEGLNYYMGTVNLKFHF